MIPKMLMVLLVAALLPANFCFAVYTDPDAPNIYNRFYVGPKPDFIGAGLNFSGVGYGDPYNLGVKSTGPWATMISPSFFVSIDHAYPFAGDTLYFHENNDRYGPVHTYQVDPDFSGNTTADTFTGTIIHVGKLTNPIPASDHIKIYPIVTFPGPPPQYESTTYTGQDVWVYGRYNRVAHNTKFTTQIEPPDAPSDYISWFDIQYNGSPGETTLLEGGDSGAPSFVMVNGQLTVAGVHAASGGFNGTAGVDPLLSPYADAIDDFVASNSNGTEHITTVPFVTPEPTSAALIVAGLGAVLLLPRRKRA